jgi:hypothetical protein
MPDARVADARTGGLVIEMVVKGGVPQMVGEEIEIELLEIGALMLRAIGDSAPGDHRTTFPKPDASFLFQSGAPAVPLLLPEAPPGLYSAVEMHVADTEASLHGAVYMLGRVRRGGTVVPFEIKNVASDVKVNVAVAVALVPREFATATVELDAAELVEDIDWDNVAITGDGKLYIGDGDGEMPRLVSAIPTAFKSR